MAQGASGNPQGILYCKLSPHHPPLSRFIQSSYQYSLRLLTRTLPQNEDTWQQCGVLQLGADERAQATAIAINFNQVGIATAFLVGGAMALKVDSDEPSYLLPSYALCASSSFPSTRSCRFSTVSRSPPASSCALKSQSALLSIATMLHCSSASNTHASANSPPLNASRADDQPDSSGSSTNYIVIG